MVILEEETYKRFGYYPNDLKLKSKKRILVACDECGKIREITRRQYCALCRSCAKKGIRNPMYGVSLTGKKHPNWQGGPVEQKCLECRKSFYTFSFIFIYAKAEEKATHFKDYCKKTYWLLTKTYPCPGSSYGFTGVR